MLVINTKNGYTISQAKTAKAIKFIKTEDTVNVQFETQEILCVITEDLIASTHKISTKLNDYFKEVQEDNFKDITKEIEDEIKDIQELDSSSQEYSAAKEVAKQARINSNEHKCEVFRDILTSHYRSVKAGDTIKESLTTIKDTLMSYKLTDFNNLIYIIDSNLIPFYLKFEDVNIALTHSRIISDKEVNELLLNVNKTKYLLSNLSKKQTKKYIHSQETQDKKVKELKQIKEDEKRYTINNKEGITNAIPVNNAA